MSLPALATTLDSVDLSILAILQEDARTSNAEIGRRVGLVPSAVFQRLRKLEDRGVVTGYEARLEPLAIGLGLIAFVSVRVDERVGSLKTASRLAEFLEVQELHHVAGEDCYLLKIRAADTQTLGRFLRERIGSIDSVLSTRTTIVLETVKETGRLPLGMAEEAS